MGRCKHVWQFVAAVVAPLGVGTETFNAVCTRCGAKTWAHGRGGW